MNILGFRCVQCQGQLQISIHGLCSRCHREIRHFPYCGKCGAELPHCAMWCGQCLRNEPNWDRLVMVGRYNEPLSSLIHRFKFQNQFWLDRTLARLLLLAIYQAKREHGLILPEAILPVPLHHFRQWQRGYNQADLLARRLAKWLHIPVQNQSLQRNKRTPTQRGLTAKARRKNLKNAFSIAAEFPYQRVAIVDDVLTTGSTVNEIAKLLRKIGVQEIQVWCLART
ncbi:ComF family protein [Pasteurella langaaensis DSM 22999]|uniref:ComF family protein n=1 Tax=Alitibacter langaaensis DSM 22999 TaxID=1122935 RepID=A0A2U0SKE2_9PAST|nr:phosphoribosyltransferase family protein [Pasteurella langaaensis]PVX31818.1 ComF family protein [Pasteurella langaaensis DSM 22999]